MGIEARNYSPQLQAYLKSDMIKDFGEDYSYRSLTVSRDEGDCVRLIMRTELEDGSISEKADVLLKPEGRSLAFRKKTFFDEEERPSSIKFVMKGESLCTLEVYDPAARNRNNRVYVMLGYNFISIEDNYFNIYPVIFRENMESDCGPFEDFIVRGSGGDWECQTFEPKQFSIFFGQEFFPYSKYRTCLENVGSNLELSTEEDLNGIRTKLIMNGEPDTASYFNYLNEDGKQWVNFFRQFPDFCLTRSEPQSKYECRK